jgi:hypothetical protein
MPLSSIELTKVAIFSILILYVMGSSSMKLLQRILRRNLSEMIDRIFEKNAILKFNFFLYVGIIATLLLCEPMILLRIFGTPLLYVLFIFLSSFLIFDLVKQRPLRKLNVNSLKTLLHMALLFIVLVIVLFDRWDIIAGVYGPIGDDIRHSGVVWTIIQNKFFTITPLSLNGVYALTTFLTALCQVSIHETGLIFSTIFSALIFLGFYSLGITHIQHFLFGYLCAFVGTFFWLDSCDPIAWGDYPLLLSFYLTLSAMAFLKKLSDSEHSFREKIIYLIVLFIPLYGTYPVPILYISVWFVLLSIYDSFLIKRNCHNFLKSIIALVFANLVSVFLNIIYLFHPIFHILSGAISYATPMLHHPWGGRTVIEVNHLLSLPFSLFSDFQNFTNRLFGWFTRRPGSFDLIPYGLILSLMILLIRVLNIKSQNEKIYRIVKISKSIFIYYFLIVIFYLYIEYVDQYLYILFPSQRVMESEGIFLTMMEALSMALYWSIFSFFLSSINFTSIAFLRSKKMIVRIKLKTQKSPRRLIMIIVSFFFSILVFSSLINIYEPINTNKMYVRQHLSTNLFLNRDDVILQSWIEKNIPDNCSILILPIDGGFALQYLNKRVVGAYRAMLFGHNRPNVDFVAYTRLLTCLSYKPDDQETLDLLKKFDVKYIYLGAYKNLKSYDLLQQIASEYDFPNFDFKNLGSETLESSINYKMIKKVGNATLFEVTNSSFTIFWKEDFFKEDWSFANTTKIDATYRWVANGNTAQLTIGSNYTPCRIFYFKNLDINLTELDYLVIRVRGSPNAKFFIGGVDWAEKILIGSSSWEKTPLNWTTYTYKVTIPGTLRSILIGASIEDGNNATVYFDYIALGRKMKASEGY